MWRTSVLFAMGEDGMTWNRLLFKSTRLGGRAESMHSLASVSQLSG
jgi:hypothetical protein